jgi:cathepsin A (carboxypeptidase C)
MNGGPGASSMMGLLTEMGPCWLEFNATRAKPNQWSWNNNASLLFIDQPAGTGLSTLANEISVPVKEQDTAQDFQQFLNIFFTDIFPGKKTLPIHIAAESYGGHFGPVYIYHILQSRRYNSNTAFWGNIKSLVLINALINWTGIYVGIYKLLCEDRKKVGLLNATACASIARNLPEQQRLGRSCDLAYKGDECRAAYNYGEKFISAPYLDLVKADKRSMGNSTCFFTLITTRIAF